MKTQCPAQFFIVVGGKIICIVSANAAVDDTKIQGNLSEPVRFYRSDKRKEGF